MTGLILNKVWILWSELELPTVRRVLGTDGKYNIENLEEREHPGRENRMHPKVSLGFGVWLRFRVLRLGKASFSFLCSLSG